MYQPAKGSGYVRNNMSCTQCQAGSAAILTKFGQPFHWLSRWLPPSAESDAQDWASGIETDALAAATYGNWAIGEWVRSSVHSHFRMSELNLDDPETVSIYRRYVTSGLVIAQGLDALVRQERPGVQLLFNGRMAPMRIALEIAKQHNIRTITEERGFTLGHLRLVENTHCLDPEPFYELWNAWKETPLSTEDIESLSKILSAHRSGTGFEMSLFAAPATGPEVTRETLGLDQERPIVTAFTSATDESACQVEAMGLLPNQADWLKRTVEGARNRGDVQFVIRAHPNTSGKRALGRNAVEADFLENLPSDAPDNVTVVQPDADISSFDLIAASTAGLVWHSSLGLEMAAMGKPVLRGGAYWFREATFMETPHNEGDYEKAIDRLLEPAEKDDQLARTVQAWRFAVCWFFRQSTAFPLVRQPDWARGDFAFESADALAPGRDQSLDRICSIIMDDAPIHPQIDGYKSLPADAERNAVAATIERFAKL